MRWVCGLVAEYCLKVVVRVTGCTAHEVSVWVAEYCLKVVQCQGNWMHCT